jgi:hypothetical protein
MKQFFFALILTVLMGRAATADVSYNVTLDTQTLGSSAAEPFSLGLELAQGDQPYGNSAVVGGFDFGSGSPSGAPTITLGDITGDLSNSVTFSDSAPLSFFAQQFVPGKTLSFSVQLGTNVSSAGIPDAFVIYVLDSTGSPIPTLAGPGADYLVIIDAAGDPNLQTFAGDTSRSPIAGGSPISISVTATAAVPEPQNRRFARLCFFASA